MTQDDLAKKVVVGFVFIGLGTILGFINAVMDVRNSGYRGADFDDY